MANQPFTQEPPKREVADHTITILGIVDGKLVLSGGDVLQAKSHEIVAWNIGDNSGVYEITKIYLKTSYRGNQDVFKIKPAREPGSNQWTSKLRRVSKKKEGHYNIEYRTAPGANPITYDPIIQLNP